MKPVELRLYKYAHSIGLTLLLGVLIAVFRAVAIIVWTWALASLIAITVQPLLDFYPNSGAHENILAAIPPEQETIFYIWMAFLALVARTVTTWLLNFVSERGAVRVKRKLRDEALNHITKLGPTWTATQSDADLAVKLSRGLDSLDRYFAEYIPQLLMTVTVTPLIIVAIWFADPLSAIIIIIIFPIIPIFMVLIGLATKDAMQKQWAALLTLSRTYLDVLRGLPTLKLFRREKQQISKITEITAEYRSRTMKVLRVTFLSGFVLDLAGTFSVALVAVTVGTKLIAGQYSLLLGLFVLILVPEAFIPVRQVGAAFHASAEGKEAAENILKILEEPLPELKLPMSNSSAANKLLGSVNVTNLQIIQNGQQLFEPLNFTASPGEIVAITGPSGVGKTTTLFAMLGLTNFSGTIAVNGNTVWSGQSPGLLAGTIAENVALGQQKIDNQAVASSLKLAGFADLDPERKLGVSGASLSGGQAVRVSLARAIYKIQTGNANILLLDEPTNALDQDKEKEVLKNLRFLAQNKITIILVTHSKQVIATADKEVRVTPAKVDTVGAQI